MEARNLISLLKKGLVFKLLTDLDQQLSKANIRHSDVSAAINNAPPWFNNVFNNNEDIRMSSLIRVIAYVTEQEGIDRETFLNELFNTSLLDYARIINVTKDEVLPGVAILEQKKLLEIIQEEKRLFVDLDSQWGYLQSKEKLNAEEASIREQIKQLIFEGGDSHGE